MKYNIRGDKLVVTDAINSYVEEKLGKLNKYFKNDDIKANVLLKVKGANRQIIEVTIPTEKFILRCEEENQDLYAAVDLCVDKLERQIRKNKTKLQRHVSKEKNVDINFDFELEAENEDIDETIGKRKKINTKPMDEEEAILEMELLGHDFFVFNNTDTDSICVVYKRKSGDYGIIETN